jgi:hypothetical protein
MEVHFQPESGSDMFGLIEAGQRLGDGFFEVLQIVSGGNFGGIGEQFVKVVRSSSILALRFVPHVVCEITASRLATGRPVWIMGKELFQRDVQLIDYLVKRRCSNMFSRKVVLAFPVLSQHSTG